MNFNLNIRLQFEAQLDSNFGKHSERGDRRGCDPTTYAFSVYHH